MTQTGKSVRLYKELNQRIDDEGDAPCRQAPDMFFIDKQDPMGFEKMRTSKALCGTCPLSLLCLEYALEANETHGIWGGTTHNERKSIQRKRITNERVYREGTGYSFR